jgi:hypothetical protein
MPRLRLRGRRRPTSLLLVYLELSPKDLNRSASQLRTELQNADAVARPQAMCRGSRNVENVQIYVDSGPLVRGKTQLR